MNHTPRIHIGEREAYKMAVARLVNIARWRGWRITYWHK